MTARPSAWMPLYVADYIADTGHLSTRQHGAYLLLLMHYWRTGEPLAVEGDKLRRIARLSTKEWSDDSADVMAFFKKDAGAYHNKRLDAELAKAIAKQAAKAEAGRKGSQKRWQTDSTGIAEPSVSQSQTDTPTPAQSPSPFVADAAGAGAAVADLERNEVRRFLETYNAELETIFTSRAPMPHASNYATALAMVRDGITAEFARPVFVAVLTRMCAGGDDPPNSLSYFRKPIAKALAASKETMPKGNPNGQQRRAFDPEQQRQDDRAAIASVLLGNMDSNVVAGVREGAVSDCPGADHPGSTAGFGGSAETLPPSEYRVLRGADGPADHVCQNIQPAEAGPGESGGAVSRDVEGLAGRPAGEGGFRDDQGAQGFVPTAIAGGHASEGRGSIPISTQTIGEAGNGAKGHRQITDDDLMDIPAHLRRGAA